MSIQASATSDRGFPAIRIGLSQKITTSGSSQQSTAMASSTTIFRIMCTANCYVSTGQNPTASASTSAFLLANYFEYFAIGPGEKIAVIQDTTSGTCYITEGG